jgi:putative addiction module component (TIGR02574 family)
VTSSVAKVFDAALALSDEDRGKLAEKLVESLDQASDPGAEQAWVAEIERRLERIEAGEATWVAMEDAVARLQRAAHLQ